MRPAQRPGSCSKAIPASPATPGGTFPQSETAWQARGSGLLRGIGSGRPAQTASSSRGSQRGCHRQQRKPPGLGPAAPMRRRSCRGAGSTTAALALKALLAACRRHHRTLHRAHRGLHHRTVETFTAPHEAARPEAVITTTEIVTAVAAAEIVTALTTADIIAAKPAEPAQHRKPPLLVLIEA